MLGEIVFPYRIRDIGDPAGIYNPRVLLALYVKCDKWEPLPPCNAIFGEGLVDIFIGYADRRIVFKGDVDAFIQRQIPRGIVTPCGGKRHDERKQNCEG